MQLFQFFIALMLFTACSSSDTPEETAKASKAKKNGKEITISENFVSRGSERHSELENARARANSTIENNETPENGSTARSVPTIETPLSLEEEPTTEPDELIALEEETPVTAPVSALNEETISLEENLTEDQVLMFSIKQRYNDYNYLQTTWTDQLPLVEEVIDQATDQEFLQPIILTQTYINDMPITDSQITELEANLSEEGEFASQEDRKNAEEMYKAIDSYVKVLDSTLQMSLLNLESAEANPEVIYAETSEEDDSETPKTADVVETPANIADTETQGQPSDTTAVSTEAEDVVETPVNIAGTEKQEQPSNTTAVSPEVENIVSITTPAQNPVTTDVQPLNTASPENQISDVDSTPKEAVDTVPDDSASNVVMTETANEQIAEDASTTATEETALENVPETANEQIAEDASTTVTEETALENVPETADEQIAEDASTTATEETMDGVQEDLPSPGTYAVKSGNASENNLTLVPVKRDNIDSSEKSFIDNVSGFFSGIGAWFSETTTSMASQFKSTFNAGWVLEPTSLNVPNTVNTVPEEKEENSDENSGDLSEQETDIDPLAKQAAVFTAIDSLLMNVFEFVQTNNIQNVEALHSYLEEVSLTPPEQRSEDETALLDVSNQIVQNLMSQTEDFNASDFIKSSGYTSNNLSEEEIIKIIEIYADFAVAGKEEKKEELAVAAPEEINEIQ